MPTRQPWEQQDGESATSWERFRIYLELPLPRSRIVLSERTGVSRRALDDMALRNRWVERARAWDAEVQRRLDAATLDETEARHRKHLQAVRASIARGVRAVADANGEVSPAEGARMIDHGIRLERVLLGEAESRSELVLAGALPELDLERLTPEERGELRALLDRPEVARAFKLDDKARGRG